MLMLLTVSESVETASVKTGDFMEPYKLLVLTFDSVRSHNLMEHDKHYKLGLCCNSCTDFVFRASTKERSNPCSEQDQNKNCKSCFLCKSRVLLLCSP